MGLANIARQFQTAFLTQTPDTTQSNKPNFQQANTPAGPQYSAPHAHQSRNAGGSFRQMLSGFKQEMRAFSRKFDQAFNIPVLPQSQPSSPYGARPQFWQSAPNLHQTQPFPQYGASPTGYPPPPPRPNTWDPSSGPQGQSTANTAPPPPPPRPHSAGGFGAQTTGTSYGMPGAAPNPFAGTNGGRPNFRPQTTGGTSYGRPDFKPQTTGGTSYGRPDFKPQTTGGTSYGRPNFKPQTTGNTSYGTSGAAPHPFAGAGGGRRHSWGSGFGAQPNGGTSYGSQGGAPHSFAGADGGRRHSWGPGFGPQTSGPQFTQGGPAPDPLFDEEFKPKPESSGPKFNGGPAPDPLFDDEFKAPHEETKPQQPNAGRTSQASASQQAGAQAEVKSPFEKKIVLSETPKTNAEMGDLVRQMQANGFTKANLAELRSGMFKARRESGEAKTKAEATIQKFAETIPRTYLDTKGQITTEPITTLPNGTFLKHQEKSPGLADGALQARLSRLLPKSADDKEFEGRLFGTLDKKEDATNVVAQMKKGGAQTGELAQLRTLIIAMQKAGNDTEKQKVRDKIREDFSSRMPGIEGMNGMMAAHLMNILPTSAGNTGAQSKPQQTKPAPQPQQTRPAPQPQQPRPAPQAQQPRPAPQAQQPRPAAAAPKTSTTQKTGAASGDGKTAPTKTGTATVFSTFTKKSDAADLIAQMQKVGASNAELVQLRSVMFAMRQNGVAADEARKKLKDEFSSWMPGVESMNGAMALHLIKILPKSTSEADMEGFKTRLQEARN